MTSLPPDVVVIARRLADVLEAAGLSYAIGGAIAYGYWAVPRATLDVDITAFADFGAIDDLFDILESSGHTLDRQNAKKHARERGQFSCKHGEIRVDVFLPSIPFYDKVERRLVKVSVAGRPAMILSAEDLVVFKLLFFRGKDIEDIKRIIATQGSRFDAEYARRSLAEMLGSDDERIRRLDELIETFGAERQKK